MFLSVYLQRRARALAIKAPAGHEDYETCTSPRPRIVPYLLQVCLLLYLPLHLSTAALTTHRLRRLCWRAAAIPFTHPPCPGHHPCRLLEA
jgi:hypothetical protein